MLLLVKNVHCCSISREFNFVGDGLCLLKDFEIILKNQKNQNFQQQKDMYKRNKNLHISYLFSLTLLQKLFRLINGF